MKVSQNSLFLLSGACHEHNNKPFFLMNVLKECKHRHVNTKLTPDITISPNEIRSLQIK